MLSSWIECLLIFSLNFVTRTAAKRTSNGQTQSNHAGGLLSRLLRRPAPAPAAPPAPPDPPVIIGLTIPSAREALRQGSTAPQPVSLTTEERLRQIYGTGGTGAGKTTLWLNMIMADAKAGRGVGVIDWRGETADLILTLLASGYAPEELADRLLLIDLRSAGESSQTKSGGSGSEPEYSVGFDPLAQGRNPYSQAMFVLDVLRRQFGSSLGPQTEELCRNMLLAMALSPKHPPLADIEIFLTSQAARVALLEGISDSTVLRFFSRYESLQETARAQWVSPVLNKITPMLALPALRRLTGDTQSVSLQSFFDARPDAIFIVCLAADEIFGAAALIGTLVVSAIASALMRSDRKKHPFFLYLDEFQNIVGGEGGASEQIHSMISESRRFFLGLALSHQSTSQLDPKLRVLIRNVVATHFVFSTGGIDADLLAGELSSEEPKAVLKQIILNQKPGEAILSRRGKSIVRIKTVYTPPPVVSPSAVQALRQASLRRHGRPATEVDAEMQAREDLFLTPVHSLKVQGPETRKPGTCEPETRGSGHFYPISSAGQKRAAPSTVGAAGKQVQKQHGLNADDYLEVKDYMETERYLEVKGTLKVEDHYDKLSNNNDKPSSRPRVKPSASAPDASEKSRKD